MARTPEGKIKDKVTALLRYHDIWYFFPASGPYGKSGIPDIIAVVKGAFWGLECKADETKKTTKLQDQTMKDIAESGGFCMVIDGDIALWNLGQILNDELLVPKVKQRLLGANNASD